MFCSNCGAQLNPNVPFCQNCGMAAPAGGNSVYSAPQVQTPDSGAGYIPVMNQGYSASQPYPVQQYGNYDNAPMNGQVYTMPYAATTEKKSSAGKVIGIIAGVVAALGVAAVVMWRCGVFMKGYEKVISKYIDALENTDAEAVVEVVAPYYNDFLCEAWECEIDEVIDDTAENIEEAYDEWEEEFGDDLKLSFEVLDTDEYSRREIDDFIDDEWYYYDYYDVEIEEAMMVTVELTIDGSEDSSTDEVEFFCVKVDGEWHIDPSIGDFIW